jgi:acetylglutamate kinase
VALKAEKLLLLTNARGVLRNVHDPHSLVSYTDLAGSAASARSRRHGARHAAQGRRDRGGAARRVPRVHILSHALPEGLLGEIFTNEGVGTLVVEELSRLQPAEQAAAPAGVGV